MFWANKKKSTDRPNSCSIGFWAHMTLANRAEWAHWAQLALKLLRHILQHITTYYNILQHITYMYSIYIYIHPCKFHVYKRVMFKTCACIEEDGITISWVDQAPKLEPRMTRTRRDNWKRFGDFTTERIQRKVPISSFRLFPWSSLVVCLQWSTARCTWNQHEKAARTRVCSMATEF